MILRKIIEIVATRYHNLRLKCTKFDFQWGSLQRSPKPAREGKEGPEGNRKGREGREERKKKCRDAREGKGSDVEYKKTLKIDPGQ